VCPCLNINEIISLAKEFQKGRKMDSKKSEDSLVSLNIKIKKDLDFRLKRARKTARKNNEIFNVSEKVSEFLLNELTKIEEKYQIQNQEFNPNQITIFDIKE